MSEEQEDLVNIEEHKAKYLEFLIDLEKTLLELEKSKQGFEEDVREYLSLLSTSSNKSTSQNVDGSILVDIGSGVYVQGIPESKDSLIVSLGYGFHAELKTTSTNKEEGSELQRFVRGKIDILKRRIEYSETRFGEVMADYEQAKHMFIMLDDLSKQQEES